MEEIKVSQTNEVIYKEVLPNGLTILMYPSDICNGFNLSLTTKFGSIHTKFKYKDEDTIYTVPNGLAHFLEHITFHLNGKEASELFEPYGAYINASTSYNRTSYIVNCNNHFNECLDNLLYYVYTNYYTEDTVANEKGIIKEEAKRCGDNLFREFLQMELKTLFHKLNYKEKIVGELEDIDSITLEDITNAYNRFYQPFNMFLIIAGNFDKDEALKVINNRMEQFTFNNREFEIIEPEEPDEVKEEYHDEEGIGFNDKVAYLIKVPLKNFKDLNMKKEELLAYIDLILDSNFGRTSLYSEELMEKGIINYQPAVYSELLSDFLIIVIEPEPNDGKVEELIDKTNKYINNITIDEDDINRKIKCNISDYILDFDTPDIVLDHIEENILYYGRYVNNYIDILKSFTVEKGKNILKCIDFDNKSIVIMRKKGDN